MVSRLNRAKKPSLACCLTLGVVALSLFGQAIVPSSAAGKQAAAATAPAAGDSIIIAALKKEMSRALLTLKNAGDAPLYYLAYRVQEKEYIDIDGSYGALTDDGGLTNYRTLDVEVRVGSPKLDNSHRIPDGTASDQIFGGSARLPIEDDEDAIRNIVWLKTDSEFRQAQKRFAQVRANKDVLVQEEDRSDDFVMEKPNVFRKVCPKLTCDTAKWRKLVRQLSGIMKEYPNLRHSYVQFEAGRVKRYIVTSDGSAIEDERIEYGIRAFADAVSDDGMVVWLFDEMLTEDQQSLADEKKLSALVRKTASAVEKLRKAPAARPFVGPAILKGKAAAVFFHEIFGHRVEGHRQKDESEGRTFADKIGVQIMPKFISVVDDPTAAKLNKTSLNGHYLFDDEGVAAQKVVLVDRGVLRRFLMSRSPVRGFARSNGHGRCRAGYAPVARQANLMVIADPSRQVGFDKLKELLRNEIRKQRKPYGLIFDDIEGGSTMTTVSEPQMFSLYPLKVTRVYADGRPDDILRGVDIVGTPLASLEYILFAGTDVQTFNGSCGAESGWIPVSASSPSLLIKTIEVSRQAKSHEKKPILPDPLHDRVNVPVPVRAPSAPVSRSGGGK